MAEGDFSLADITTALTLINHLFTVSLDNFRLAARYNAEYFAYEGFNATAILEAFIPLLKTARSAADALQDLCDIVNIGLTRGNIRVDQLNKTSTRGKERIEALAKKYNIKMKKNVKDKIELTNSTMTFTRSISVFPYVASQLIAAGSCLIEPIGCKFGGDLLPNVMKHTGFAGLVPTGTGYCQIILTAYVAYMMSFSRKINPNSKESDEALYAKQWNFTKAAWQNLSVCSQENRILAMEKLGLNSHNNHGATFLTVCNRLREAIKKPAMPASALTTYVRDGIWYVNVQTAVTPPPATETPSLIDLEM